MALADTKSNAIKKSNHKKLTSGVLTCDKLVINNTIGRADVYGDVMIETEEGTIKSEKAYILFDKQDLSKKGKKKQKKVNNNSALKISPQIKKIFFLNGVHFTYNNYDVTSDNAVFDNAFEIMMLDGNVKVEDEQTRSSASFFIYNMQTEKGYFLSENEYKIIKPYYVENNIKYIYNYFYDSKNFPHDSSTYAGISHAGKSEADIKERENLTQEDGNLSRDDNDEDKDFDDIVKENPNRVTVYRSLESSKGKGERDKNHDAKTADEGH